MTTETSGIVAPADTSASSDVSIDDRVRRWGWKVLAAATSFVILLSAVRGIRRGYEAIGDNALIELRGRDVLTGNHPLLGTWSSASISSSVDVNHPGPLLFDVVALPVRLFGGAVGIALAIAALNIAVVWAVGFVTARTGGPTAAIIAQVITAGLVWTLGSELLYDPWQPNVLVLPFWLLMCTVWAVIDDDVVLLPLAVAVGSFCMQTHLGYLFLVPILLAFALVVVVLRRRRGGPGRFRDLRGTVAELGDRRSRALGPAAVGAVLRRRPGQPRPPAHGRHRRLGGGSGEEHHRPVRRRATVQLGRRPGPVVAAPGLRHVGAEFDVDRDARGRACCRRPICPGSGVALGGAGAVRRGGGARLGGGPAQRTRRHRAGYWLLALCSGVAMVTLIITPIDVLGLTPHKIRYLWIIGAFATYLLVLSLLCVLRADDVPRCGRRARRGGSGRGGRHDPGPRQRRGTGVLQRHATTRSPTSGHRCPTTSPVTRSLRRRSGSTPVGSGSPSRTRRR